MTHGKSEKKLWHSPEFDLKLPGRRDDLLATYFGEAIDLNTSPPFINSSPLRTSSLKRQDARKNNHLPTADEEFLLPSNFRPRVATMPSPRRCTYSPASHAEMSEYRGRSMSFVAKSPRAASETRRSVRRQPSNASAASWSSGYGSRDRTWNKISQTTALSRARSDSSSSLGATRYSVAVVGSQGVGKTSLVNQFISTEKSSLDHDDYTDVRIQDKCLQITLNGEMSDLIFHDQPAAKIPPEIMIREKDVDAYLVLFSITDRVSFCRAKSILAFLHQCDFIKDKAVILVGNKTDLERGRVVQTEGRCKYREGKSVAISYECKFIETSDWMTHNVDELLVGLLSQIRLKLQRYDRQEKKQQRALRYKGSKTSLSRSRSVVRDLLKKLNYSKSKSCDNLHVL
uniref:Uncharacterized protein n=1 Tax=Strigamia maritima TaxID=126957 RepID=T1J265_STRMM